MGKRIMLQNMHECSNPERVLMVAFAMSIREAYAQCPNIYKYGVKIENDNLEYPIEVVFRDKWQNSPGALLNEFLKVMQSNNATGVYGSPLKITITAIQGANGGHPVHIKQNARPRSLIQVG